MSDNLTSFNPDQLVNLPEAREIVEKINARGDIGGGVLPEDASNGYENEKSGIYLEHWEPGPGDFPRPQIGDALSYMLRFSNGTSGFNIGLTRTVAKNHSAHDDSGVWLGEYNWDFALNSLKAEVDAQFKAHNPDPEEGS